MNNMNSNPSSASFCLLSEGILEVICSFLPQCRSLRLVSSSFDRGVQRLHGNSASSNSFANTWAKAGAHLEEMLARREQMRWMKNWKIETHCLSTFFLSASASSASASSSSSAQRVLSPDETIELMKSCFGALPGDHGGPLGLCFDFKHTALKKIDFPFLIQSVVSACSHSLSRLRIYGTDLHQDKYFKQLMKIPSLSSLSSLEFIQTNLDSDDVSFLASLLPIFTNLTHLSFGSPSSYILRNIINRSGLKSLIPALSSSKILSLNLLQTWNRVDAANTRSDSTSPLCFDFISSLSSNQSFFNLTNLNLQQCVLHGIGIATLVQCAPLLSRLRHLNVRDCRIDTQGALDLFTSPYLMDLVTLDIGRNLIYGREFPTRLKVPTTYLQCLKSLKIDHCYELWPVGLQYLLRLPFMSQLTFLNVAANGIGSSGFRALFSSPSCRRLQSLDSSMNEIGDRAADCVANSKYFDRDLHLDLSMNMITASGLKRLSSSPLFPCIKFACNSQIGVEGMRVLSKLKSPAFDTLDLSGCLIGDEGLELLCSVGSCLANVRRLMLRWNHLSSQGLKAFSNASLKHLIHLDISENRIDDDGANWLANWSAVRLESLDVSTNRITQAGMDALTASPSLRRTRILFDDTHESLYTFKLPW